MPVSLAGSSSAAMHGAIVPIASSTSSGSVSDIMFQNIPQIYQDLMLVISARGAKSATTASFIAYVGTGANGTSLLQSNQNSATVLYGDGTSALSTRTTNASGLVFTGGIPAASATSGIFGSLILHFINYTNSSTNKTVLMRSSTDRNGAGNTNSQVGLVRTTSPLLTVGAATYGDGNLVSGTTFTLYGVRSVGQ